MLKQTKAITKQWSWGLPVGLYMQKKVHWGIKEKKSQHALQSIDKTA